MRIIMISFFCLMLAEAAMAQTNCQTIGNQTYCNGPNGYNSNSQTYGNNTYIQERNNSGQQRQTTCQRIGNQTYCN